MKKSRPPDGQDQKKLSERKQNSRATHAKQAEQLEGFVGEHRVFVVRASGSLSIPSRARCSHSSKQRLFAKTGCSRFVAKLGTPVLSKKNWLDPLKACTNNPQNLSKFVDLKPTSRPKGKACSPFYSELCSEVFSGLALPNSAKPAGCNWLTARERSARENSWFSAIARKAQSESSHKISFLMPQSRDCRTKLLYQRTQWFACFPKVVETVSTESDSVIVFNPDKRILHLENRPDLRKNSFHARRQQNFQMSELRVYRSARLGGRC